MGRMIPIAVGAIPLGTMFAFSKHRSGMPFFKDYHAIPVAHDGGQVICEVAVVSTMWEPDARSETIEFRRDRNGSPWLPSLMRFGSPALRGGATLPRRRIHLPLDKTVQVYDPSD